MIVFSNRWGMVLSAWNVNGEEVYWAWKWASPPPMYFKEKKHAIKWLRR